MTKQIHIWIDTELKEKTEQYCKENDTSLSQLTRKLLREFLQTQN